LNLPLDDIRMQIDRELRTRRFLDYFQSSQWALEKSPLVEELRRESASQPSAELVELIERAARHVVNVILHADDSDGLIGDLAAELLELHWQVCTTGVADPKKLARWMVRFSIDDQDFFTVDPVRYADALQTAGMTAYRREIQRRVDSGDDAFAVRYATERLAVLDGDVDEIVRLLGGELTRPYDFIRVATAMEELGRDDDVLRWAGRGIVETSGWQVAQLYDLMADAYRRRGDVDQLLPLRREGHNRMPSVSSYAHLKEAAEAAGLWADERDLARNALGVRDRGALVDVLLAEGEVDQAWAVAGSAGESEIGRRRWQVLADARMKSDPADALDAFLNLADQELAIAGRPSYGRAIKLLKKAARSAEAAGRTAVFDEHVRELREQYRRRPSMLSMFDRAGL
jgi:hypothetical protein